MDPGTVPFWRTFMRHLSFGDLGRIDPEISHPRIFAHMWRGSIRNRVEWHSFFGSCFIVPLLVPLVQICTESESDLLFRVAAIFSELKNEQLLTFRIDTNHELNNNSELTSCSGNSGKTVFYD